MNTIIDLDNRLLQAAIANEFAKMDAIRRELNEARQRKDSLLDAYKTHAREHGC